MEAQATASRKDSMDNKLLLWTLVEIVTGGIDKLEGQ